jgi:Flp pilus assembly protein TadD
MVGMLLEMQKKLPEARAKYEQIIAIDPHAAVAANNLAWIYAESGENLDVALRLAQTAKSRMPDRAEVNDTLGWIYHKKGLGSQAVVALRDAVDKDPQNASFQYHLGMAHAATGDAVQARAALQKALLLASEFDGAAEAKAALSKLGG